MTPARRFLAAGLVLLAGSRPGEDGVRDREEGARDFVGLLTLRANLPVDFRRLEAPVFLGPTWEDPSFRIAVPLGAMAAEESRVVEVRAGEVPVASFAVWRDGWQDHEGWITRPPEPGVPEEDRRQRVERVALLAKHPWRAGEELRIRARIEGRRGGAAFAEWREAGATAPPTGGMPAGLSRGRFAVLGEEAGLPREAEAVLVEWNDLADGTGELADRLRVQAWDPERGAPAGEVPVQVFGVRRSPGSRFGPEGVYGHVAFLAGVPARGRAMYLLALAERRGPAPATDLEIRGEGPGAVVGNRFLEARFHGRSGQLDGYTLKYPGGGRGPRLQNSRTGAVHWNPDAFGPGGWGHAFSWDPPERIHVEKGPVLYRQCCSGPMPQVPEVAVTVTYTVFASCPWVVVETAMETLAPVPARAIRNGEMVFDATTFDHFAWREAAGQVWRCRALLDPDPGFDAPVILPADTPWVALWSRRTGLGLAAVQLAAVNLNRLTGTADTYREAYFLYCHPQWPEPLTYFVRTLVYPFGYAGRQPPVLVGKGNLFVERLACLPFVAAAPGSDRPGFAAVAEAEARLRHPLRVRWGE